MSPVQGSPSLLGSCDIKVPVWRNVELHCHSPCAAHCLLACLSRSLVFASSLLHSIVSLSPAHHVIGRESSPHPSRFSRRVVRAHTTATTPVLTRTGQIWRCRTLIRERRAYSCARLEGMLYSSLCPRYTNHYAYMNSVLSLQASWRSSLHVYLLYCRRLRRRTSSSRIHRRHRYRPYLPRPQHYPQFSCSGVWQRPRAAHCASHAIKRSALSSRSSSHYVPTTDW